MAEPSPPVPLPIPPLEATGSPPSPAEVRNPAPKPESHEPPPAGPAGPDKPAPGKPAPPPAESLKSKIEIISRKEFNNFFLAEKDWAFQQFSHRQCITVREASEKTIKEECIFEEELINAVLEKLLEKRFLILTGEPELGKKTLALWVCARLRFEDPEALRETLVVSPLGPRVNLDFRDVADNVSDFGGRSLLFYDALSRNHPGIRDFLASLDLHHWQDLATTLKRHRMFLLFTATSESVRPVREQLAQCGLEFPLPLPQEALLQTGFHHSVKHLAALRSGAAAAFSPQDKAYLIQETRTLPRLVHCLRKILLEDVAVQKAVAQVNDVKGWFLEDLTDELETWCFALTLGMCLCLPEFPGVPWFEFEVFRNAFTRRLARKLRVPLRREPVLKDLVSEESWLVRCQAEIYKDPDTGADYVRFRNHRSPEMMWDVLLQTNRKVLVMLLPELKSLAQVSDPGIRARAAHMLGRLGEIDPWQITFSLMNEWIETDNLRQWATVGYLFQGILADQRPAKQRYHEDCLFKLKGWAKSQDTEYVWTAIATYRQIGLQNLSLAMQNLREIAERKLIQPIDEKQRLDRILDRIEKVLADEGFDEAAELEINFFHAVLRDLAARIYNQESSILYALQYALVAMCFQLDPIRVWEELQLWMNTEQKALSALVVLVFLQAEGIAERLEQRQIEFADPASQSPERVQSCSRIVVAFTYGERALPVTVRFLEAIFKNFSDYFPSRTRRLLQRSFFAHLKQWVKDAYPVERCRLAMEHLVALLAGSDKQLWGQLFDFLNSDPAFRPEGELYQFTKAVLKRKLNGTSGA